MSVRKKPMVKISTFFFFLDSSWVIIGGMPKCFCSKMTLEPFIGLQVRLFENFGKIFFLEIFFGNSIKTEGVDH